MEHEAEYSLSTIDQLKITWSSTALCLRRRTQKEIKFYILPRSNVLSQEVFRKLQRENSGIDIGPNVGSTKHDMNMMT
jgi:hypothetical protein